MIRGEGPSRPRASPFRRRPPIDDVPRAGGAVPRCGVTVGVLAAPTSVGSSSRSTSGLVDSLYYSDPAMSGRLRQ